MKTRIILLLILVISFSVGFITNTATKRSLSKAEASLSIAQEQIASLQESVSIKESSIVVLQENRDSLKEYTGELLNEIYKIEQKKNEVVIELGEVWNEINFAKNDCVYVPDDVVRLLK